MSEQVSYLFVRLAELAEAEGAVPEDGSGVDGVWTTTVPARERERDWNIALNAEVDEERTVEDFPAEGDETTVPPIRAVIELGRWPAGVLGPHGGQVLVEELEDGPQSLEDELIEDVEARIEHLEGGADAE